MTDPAFIEGFFRHQYGNLVSMLAVRVGLEHLEEVEDAVQSALVSAVENWAQQGRPENPTAWLYRVSLNSLLGELRKNSRRTRLLQENFDRVTKQASSTANRLSIEVQDEEIQDSVLRMMFVCCDHRIPQSSQVVCALKILSGFSVREIAIRLFTSEANIYKRWTRARDQLRKLDFDFCGRSDWVDSNRRPSVLKVLYVLFTEGYLSSDAEVALRRDLCNEAIRLTKVLVQHPAGRHPETYALLSLMLLHTARMNAREDGGGGVLLLEEQDRGLWDKEVIQEGLVWLGKSAEGDNFSSYHAEAGIAAEHCLAKSFEETRWDKISECYSLLLKVTDSPVHRLNHAIALAEWKGPDEALSYIKEFQPPTWLTGSYLWAAVMADLNRRCGNLKEANYFKQVALATAPTEHLKKLLDRRLEF